MLCPELGYFEGRRSPGQEHLGNCIIPLLLKAIREQERSRKYLKALVDTWYWDWAEGMREVACGGREVLSQVLLELNSVAGGWG